VNIWFPFRPLPERSDRPASQGCLVGSGRCTGCQGILTGVSVIALNHLPADPVEALRELTRGEEELERVRRDRVRAARDAGVSWDRIGAALGMSRQAAWEYYNRDLRERLRRNVEANTELSESEAMDLAVSEAQAVRRRRRPGPAPR
jgi:hypothetical protein